MTYLTSSNYKSTSEISYPQGRNLSLLFFYFLNCLTIQNIAAIRHWQKFNKRLVIFCRKLFVDKCKVRPLLAGKSDKSSEIKISTEKSFDKIRHENFPQLRMIISCNWEWFSRDTPGSVVLNENCSQLLIPLKTHVVRLY